MQKLRRRRRNDVENNTIKTGQLMNLSLFIMLLAFFIVLNAMSSYEPNLAEPIIKSLDNTFSTDAVKKDAAPSVKEDPVQSVNEGDIFDRIDALFTAQIVSYKKTISSNRGEMMLELPLEKFSQGVMAAGQKDLTTMSTARNVRGNFLVPTLVSIIKSEQRDITYRMDIMMHVSDNPANLQNQNPTKIAAVMRRGSALAQKLEQGGFSQKLINIGLKKGDEKMVELVFRRHEPFQVLTEEERLLQGGAQ
ncbi:MAG: hypothetical protein GW903_01235 [Alphaproteobacteria bacterium]|nr:hypothetical protein [Alphaproteobacteria bacterium]NCQ87594.1 hypothetical protein [Alphaproteobacteria bacterium]NCT06463.1 hypothetical protein [Alphaproteobacteria bacterium]